MNIIIVGSGKVGYTLAENLANEKHYVTIIDNNDAAIQKANDSLDVLCLKGNGASVSMLKQAGCEKADVLIATTGRDEVNMVCCLTAKKLGVEYTIARIRDYDYALELSQLKREMDIDMVINPEHATAMQITRLLRFPNALDIETFYRGRIELIGFRVNEGDIIAGESLSVVRRKIKNIPILFCALEHEGKTIIPHGSTVIRPGDKLYVIGQVVDVNHFFRALGRISQKIKDVLILGGGRICMYLSRPLLEMGMNVKIIENDRKQCVTLCEALPKALVVNGDGTEQDVLDSEAVEKFDAFVALTGRDEDNLITSLYVKQTGVPKVIAKINRQNYFGILGELDIDSIISPKLITAYTILKNVRGMQNSHGSRMEALYQIANRGAEAIEFVINSSTKHLGIPLCDLKLKKGVLIAVIMRKSKFIIPDGNSVLLEGDDIIVIISNEITILDINDIYED